MNILNQLLPLEDS